MKDRLIRYTLHSKERDGSEWTSVTLEAADMREVTRAVLAGWLCGIPRWAENEDGFRLYGIGADGTTMAEAKSFVLHTARTRGPRMASW